MITELATAIRTQYNTLTLGSSALSAVAPIYFGVAPDMVDYPFSSYYIIDGLIDPLDTCNDQYDFTVQLSIFDRGNSPLTIMSIMDVVIPGFNETSLSGLDGTQINLEPKNAIIQEIENDNGHQGIVEVRAYIEKTR